MLIYHNIDLFIYAFKNKIVYQITGHCQVSHHLISIVTKKNDNWKPFLPLSTQT